MKRQHMGKMSLRSLLGPVSLWLFAPMLLGLVDSRNQNRAPIAVFIVLGIALLAVIFILVLTIPISAEELKYARFGGFGGFGGFRGYGRFGVWGAFKEEHGGRKGDQRVCREDAQRRGSKSA